MVNQQSQKRHVAYKLMIKDILDGEYLKEDGLNPNFLKLKDGKNVSRVNLIATIINKTASEDPNYQSLMIDDGSGTISLKSFDSQIASKNFNIGDSVLVIGRPREFGNERYIAIEIIKSIDNKLWIELRRSELNKDYKIQKTNIEVYNINEEIIEEDSEIMSIIRKLDKGDGADFNEIIQNSNNKDMEKIINNMIKSGELFEIKPGKIKILE